MARPPDEGLPTADAGTRTARSKFLEVVKGVAEANHLELVVDPDGPNSGYGYIQKRDHFSNLYAFHFEFGDASAVFYLGTESTKELSSERRKEVEYSDGKAMELVLEEIRKKIGQVAEEAHPRLPSLSKKTAAPPSMSEAAMARPSSRNDAAVWGQDEISLARDRYRYKKMPRRSYAPEIVSVVLILVVLFTLAPVLQSHGSMTTCKAASCETSKPYLQSVSFRILGVGALYLPLSSWGLGTGTVQAGNATTRSGLGVSHFYIVW